MKQLKKILMYIGMNCYRRRFGLNTFFLVQLIFFGCVLLLYYQNYSIDLRKFNAKSIEKHDSVVTDVIQQELIDQCPLVPPNLGR